MPIFFQRKAREISHLPEGTEAGLVVVTADNCRGSRVAFFGDDDDGRVGWERGETSEFSPILTVQPNAGSSTEIPGTM